MTTGQSCGPLHRGHRPTGGPGRADDQGLLCDAGVLGGPGENQGGSLQRPLVQDRVKHFTDV